MSSLVGNHQVKEGFTNLTMSDLNTDTLLNMTSEESQNDEYIGCSLTSDAGIILSVMMQAIACILGLVGNIFVITAIATTRKLQTTTSVYIGNLTMLDLLTCSLMMPANMIGQLCGAWPLGDTTCIILGHMMWYIACLALLTLAVIATSRYLLVARSTVSFSRICSRRNVLICLLALWASSAFIYFVPVTILMNQNLMTITFSPDYTTCNVVILHGSATSSAGVTWILSLPLCLFVLIGCIWIPHQFVLTFRAVRRSKQRLRAFQSPRPRPPRLGLTREELHLTKILLLIYILFFCLWMPLVLNLTLSRVFMVPSENIQKHVFTVYLLGSALNPYIYGWMNPKFRRAFRRLVSKQCCACRCRKNTVVVMT